MRLLNLIVLCLTAATVSAEQIAEVTLERSWGLQLGDAVTLQIQLPADSAELDRSALPQRDRRHGPWLHLLNSELTEVGVDMHFQLVNVPVEKQQLETPVFSLRTADGQFIEVPSVTMTIGSMLATDLGEIRAAMLKADHPPQLLKTEAPRQQLQLASALLLLSLLVLLIWHLGLRPRQRQPFATAVFRLRLLQWRGQKDNDKAARLLHEAINRSVQTVVVHSQLEQLWQAAPWLQPLQPEIEQFYQQSSAHYFSRGGAEVMDFKQILKLAKACRSREKLA